ncbi:MAG: archease [Armatimonadota bacterium]|nr:archease [Armatimonadota bacterium]
MEGAGHESIEHTADLAIRAWAPDLAGLIEQAAEGMIEFIVARRVDAERTVQVEGQGETPEDLLVDCLREVLLLIELEGLVPMRAEVAAVEEGRATLMVGAVALERAREVLQEDIKAVTYHGLEIDEADDVLQAEVVFDV